VLAAPAARFRRAVSMRYILAAMAFGVAALGYYWLPV